LQVDAFALQVNAFALQVDAFTLQVDAFTLQVDAFALQVNAFALQVDAMTKLRDALLLYDFSSSAIAERVSCGGSISKLQIAHRLEVWGYTNKACLSRYGTTYHASQSAARSAPRRLNSVRADGLPFGNASRTFL
jgi:hypothetical protein